jgi:KDO2-lipid IV(A) lauroyltransferase
MTLVSKLAHKANATVFLAFAERLPNSQGFHIHFIEGSSEIANQDLNLGTAIMNQNIEQLIRLAPAQYEWSYKRFRRRPNNEASIY